VVGAVLLLLATGICYTIYTSTTNALVQLSAPPYLQGRVAGLYSYIFAGSSPFGALLAGSLAAQGGTDLAFVVAGVVALGSALFGLLMWRRLRVRPEMAETVAKSA
jgi:MFS family permease